MVMICLSISEVSDLATAISCFLAFLGLVYAGYQFKQNADSIKKNTFINSNERFIELRKMIIEDPDLDDIYKTDKRPIDLSAKEECYVLILIAFCESLYLTDQIDIFPDLQGGNWRNFIKHTIITPTIYEVWKDKTEIRDPDFSKSFIDFVNQLIKE